MYSESHVGKCYRHCKGHRFFHFFKTRKFLSKLKIENERYVHLIFSVKFFCPLEGWGYVRIVFGYASVEKLKITFNVYGSADLARSASFVAHLCYSVEY